MSFNLSLAEALTLVGLVGAIVGWILKLTGRISALETSCKDTDKAIRDSAKMSAQAIANLAEESREARAHLREIMELRVNEWNETRKLIPEILTRLTRIESKTNGGAR